MINTFRKDADSARSGRGRLALLCSLFLLATGCGKDDNDGDIRNSVALPTDFVLELYCPNVGLNTETCVLDDPDNPYANTPFVTADPSDDVVPGEEFNNAKFDLANAAPSAKARFYVYATALAIAPTGENQWYTARALHDIYTETVTAAPPGSELLRVHTVRAYRSLLDNFFDSATFFENPFVPSNTTYPVKLRELTAQDLAMTPAGFQPLFNPVDADDNEFLARNAMGSWGFTWAGMISVPNPDPFAPTETVEAPGPVTKN